MIQVEKNGQIYHFANEDMFCEWLIQTGYVRDISDFVNDEYTAWEILSERYDWDSVWAHYWDAEVRQKMYDWFGEGYAYFI